MKTCDDKSEGKTFIHRPKYPLEKKLKFLHNNCMLLLYLF